jgi:hypothetical protein
MPVLIKSIDEGKSELSLVLEFEGKSPLKTIIDNYMQKKLRDGIQKAGKNIEESSYSLSKLQSSRTACAAL